MQVIKPVLCGAILILFATNTLAQRQDFIVTLKNDTIYGNLRSSLGVIYKLESEQSDISIDVDHVDAYYSAARNTFFRRKILPGKKRFLFLPCMELGRINLYEAYVTNSSPNSTYNKTTISLYAEKETNPLVEVWTNRGMFGNSNKKQREALANLLTDNPRVKQIFDGDTKYGSVDVDYYIHEYNKDAAGR